MMSRATHRKIRRCSPRYMRQRRCHRAESVLPRRASSSCPPDEPARLTRSRRSKQRRRSAAYRASSSQAGPLLRVRWPNQTGRASRLLCDQRAQCCASPHLVHTCSSSLPPQCGVQPWVHTPCVVFVYLLFLCLRQLRRRIDVASRVVVVEAGFRVDAANGADHLTGKQNIVHRDYLGQKINAGLMVDARIKEHVVQQVIFQERFLQFLCQTAITPPVIRNCASAVRYHEPQRWEILEQVSLI